MMNIKKAKTHLRSFMREHYTDERLAWLLAHARAGKLAWCSTTITGSPAFARR